jgi:hypothetical protein
MKRLIYLILLGAWITPHLFAQDNNLIQRCIDKSQALKSYHTDIFYRDLFDKKTEDEDYHSIEWKVDRLNPDRIYVEQMALTDGSADIWIAINNRMFRFFGAWIETTGEPKDTADFHSFLLLDKYLDILRDETPVNQSQDGNLVLISFTPKKWVSFAKSWQLRDGYSCNIKIWIDPQKDLIQKAYINLDGKYSKEDTECRFEMTQVFTNYNGDIKIEEPKTVNVKAKNE